MLDTGHVSVLSHETLQLLDPRPGGRFVDCTMNGGGHSAALLERTAPDGRLLGMDADGAAVAFAGQRFAPFGERACLVHENFRYLAPTAEREGFTQVDGVLMDLGFSSRQMDGEGRGFSFQRDEALDMRYDSGAGLAAADLLATAPIEEIERILREFGEEPHARRIARDIVAVRIDHPVRTTGALANLVARAVHGRHGRLHPATRTFQALRIAVNDELGALAEALPQALGLLRQGGRLAVISFHSLEDRIVKTFFRRLAGLEQDNTPRHLPPVATRPAPELRILTSRPVTPSAEEVAANPRSRSARLRVAERL